MPDPAKTLVFNLPCLVCGQPITFFFDEPYGSGLWSFAHAPACRTPTARMTMDHSHRLGTPVHESQNTTTTTTTTT